MFTYEGLNENFQFLILEIKKQLEETLKALENPEESDYYIERVTHSGDYVDNLKNIIARKSYSQILRAGSDEKTSSEDKKIIDNMMAVNTIASNLEKIGDYCENIVKQLLYFSNEHFINRYSYVDYFSQMFEAIDLMGDSLFKGDIQTALTICRTEYKIDNLYKRDFDTIMLELKEGEENHGDLITAMNILRYLERAGDALLNAGEAIISSVVGTRIKVNQYMALTESLDTENEDDFILETIGMETRSGCRIEKVRSRQTDEEWHEVIFKEGKIKKLKEEKENLEVWNQVFPGLVPKIFSYEERGENATLLLEYLGGRNFQEILMSGREELIGKSLKRIIETVNSIWTNSRREEPAFAGFLSQLRKRLDDVYNVHPYFRDTTKFINNMEVPSFEKLLDMILELEHELESPFSVMIHGDFNNDNLIYNETRDNIYYIDIHRSGHMDYVQDVSVFIVSNFRLPILDSTPRDYINRVIVKFYEFASRFAKEQGDDSFHGRLALGLIRSFVTSTRFALQRDFAKAMFYRAVFLMERLIDHRGKPWKDFHITRDVILY